jgi:acid phosphatase
VIFRSLLIALALALTGCGNHGGLTHDPDATGPLVSTVPGALPKPDHVVVVVFENKDEAQVVGASSAPYLTSLAKTGAALDNAHGIAHPSQPNYVALLSGSPYTVSDDSCPQRLGPKPNLARQLLNAGYTFAGYSESMPAQGFTGCSGSGGDYARKHNPWSDFSNIPKSDNRTYGAFPDDLSKLPTVAFVVPNMCHDMHDCSVRTGDAWARAHLARYLTWAKTHRSLLIVTFDEDSGSSANHIPTILVGPMVRKGQVHQWINHYTLLRTLEDMYGLPALSHAARAHPITAWQK